MDTSISYTDKQNAYFSSDEQKWIRKIRLLKDKFPESVNIKCEPETNDGCICAVIPVEWVKISPKRERNMTEEQRIAVIERLKNARENRTNSQEV